MQETKFIVASFILHTLLLDIMLISLFVTVTVSYSNYICQHPTYSDDEDEDNLDDDRYTEKSPWGKSRGWGLILKCLS